MSDAWTALMQNALLGTGRQPFTAAAGAAPVTQIVGGSDANDEQKLLSSITVLATARRAGCLPGAAVCKTQPATAETIQPVAEPGVAVLRRLLSDCPALLPEFYECCQRAGRRIPEIVLVDVLAHAEASPPIRSLLFSLLGARGHWLAAQNSEWSFASATVNSGDVEQGEPDASVVWQTGSTEQRLAAVRVLRVRKPDVARALVEGSWSQEPPDIRAEVLKAFRAGLSIADEPFLEKCLDDRRKEVRAVAQELLIQLPDSACARRFLERAFACFKIEKQARGFLGKLTGAAEKVMLQVELPAVCDKAMERDGIDRKVPAGQSVGERGWWFCQILGKVAPFRLAERLEISVEEFERVAREHPEWGKEIVHAWMQAAKNCRDPDLALRLYRQSPDASLLGIMRPDQCERLLVASIASAKNVEAREVVVQALGTGARLSCPVAQALIGYLRRVVASDTGSSSYPWTLPWEALALAIPQECCQAAVAGWSAKEEWQKHLEKFLNIVQLRMSIYQTTT